MKEAGGGPEGVHAVRGEEGDENIAYRKQSKYLGVLKVPPPPFLRHIKYSIELFLWGIGRGDTTVVKCHRNH
jgi:hypothetical protein